MVHTRVSMLVLLACCQPTRAVLNATLAERIASGECVAASVELGGTFFPPETRVTKDEAGALYFDVLYAPTFKVVISKVKGELYVLTQCGQGRPTAEEVDSIAPSYSGYTRKHFDVPLRSYAAESTVHLGFLNSLDVDDRAGHVSRWATEPCWQKAVGCGAANVDDWSGFDAVFTSELDGGSAYESTSVYVPAVEDPSPLNTAEYLKFIGVFFNRDAEASQLFTAVQQAYEAADPGLGDSPTVAWVSYSAAWGETPALFTLSEAAFKVHLIEDAGGQKFDAAAALAALPGYYVTGDSESGLSHRINISAYSDAAAAGARFIEALSAADAIIDETYAYNPFEYSIESFQDTFALSNGSSFQFMENKLVLRFDGTLSESNGYDWFESRIARPDWAVNGLARQLHKDSTRPFRYFRNIAEGEQPQVLTAAMCSVSLPLCGEGAPQVILTLGDGQFDAGNGFWTSFWIFVGIVLVLAAVAVGARAYAKRQRVMLQEPTQELAAELADA